MSKARKNLPPKTFARASAPGSARRQTDPLKWVCARLGLPAERIELRDALDAIRRALDQGLLMEAEVLCRFVLAQRPEQPDAWALRGEVALADQDPASARVYFHEALRMLDLLPAAQDVRKQRHIYWKAIALCNEKLNRRELAEAAWLQAARYDPQLTVSVPTEDQGRLLSRAYAAILENRLDEAEPWLKAVLQDDRGNAYAWQGLAVLEHKRGNHEAAIRAIDKAIELKPDEAGFWNNRGVVLKPLGMPKIEERIQAYQRAVALNPNFKEAYSNLADALTSARRYDEARAALDAALAIDPDYIGARINEVNLLKAQGDKRQALQRIEAILEKVRHPEALNLKGALLLETHDAHAAVAVLEEARQLDSRNASVLNNLGNAYLATQRPAKAIEAYRSAVILAPGMAEAQANLALALLTQIQHGAPRGEYLALAKQHLAQAQALDPHMPQLFIAEGILKAQHQNDREGAQSAYEKALALKPESVEALMGLAGIAADMGDRKRARELYTRAAQLAPDDVDVMTSYIFALNYDPDSSPQEIFEAAKQYGRHIQARAGAPYTSWPNERDPNKRLKVGFVSGDFRRHPTAYLIAGLLKALPRHEFEVYVYSNNMTSDDMTGRIKDAADHWRNIFDLSTDGGAALIYADGIDILIDLSGHTGYHRLDVFAKKPAPIQATYLGFHSGTGLSTVDYYVNDQMNLEGLEDFYLENFLHIPYAWNMDASFLPRSAAQLRTPYQNRGYITIGSLNNPIKYSEAVITAWARILKESGAVLHQRYRAFSDPAVSKAFIDRFVKHGVSPSQIKCEGALPREEALKWLTNNVDFGLDPFPYGSHTTALESFAMGVPMIALYGERVPGRVCATFLRRLGLADWTANRVDEYINLAIDVVKNPERISAARTHLLTLMPQTEILNSTRFAATFSKAMRQAWKKYCFA